MSRAKYFGFDPLFSEADAADMVELCHRFGKYKTYGDEPVDCEFGQGLLARHDAALNFIKTGGRFGRKDEDIETLGSRTNYFREDLAYDGKEIAEGIGKFLHNPDFIAAAKGLYDCEIIEPQIVFANLLVPGQELAVHTDVGEFRGANRKKLPQWLIVAMHHSGLFQQWRMPIATGVSWYHDADGGDFAFYPEGADGAPEAVPVRYNTAILLDTDSVFHGVDRMTESTKAVPHVELGSALVHVGDRQWEMQYRNEVRGTYHWDELRYSVSWKAYCFADAADRDRWHTHSEDLSLDFILDTLIADLRERGRLDERPDDTDLALTIIDEYIRYPAPAPAPAEA